MSESQDVRKSEARKMNARVANNVIDTPMFDVLIVGAGLSGIGAAVHLQRECPGKSFVILEMRTATGGTCDLFRYPGMRCDSGMYTLGYNFKPWTNPASIADGSDICEYIHDTAHENGIDKKSGISTK